MPYIGRELDSGNYLKLDDISSSFDGSTTTFNLTAGGKAFFPGSAFSILVNLAGVAQEPEAAYQINNSQITFASAPASGDQFFCIVLGVAHGVNVPGNGTVDGAQLKKPFNYDGFFYLDDANNRVGVGTATPAKPLHVVGEGQFDSVRVLGDLTVDGTTTTLDTVVTEVDRLEISANNSTVGVAITQSGNGDILNLYDGSSSVFSVADGGTVTASGDISIADKIIHTGDTNTAIRFPAADTITAETGGSERLRIDSDGRLLLGATSPGASALADDLVISKSGHTGMTIRSTDSNNSSIYFADGTSGDAQYRGWLEYHHSSDTMRFATSAAERMKIAADGKVGIGTNSPQSQFEVLGSSPVIRSKNTNQAYTQINHNGTDGYVDWSSGNLILRGASNTERLRIDSNGNVGVGTVTPNNYSNYTTFTINGTTGGQIDVESNGAKYGDIYTQSNAFHVRNKQASGSGFLAFHTTNSGTCAEKLRITSDGKVGIGTNDPARALDVRSGNSTDVVQFSNDSGNKVTFGVSSTQVSIDLLASKSFRIRSGSDDRFNITTDGKLIAKSTHSNGAVNEALRITTLGTYSSSNSANAGPAISFGQFHGNYPTWTTAQVTGIRKGANWHGALAFYTNDGGSETDISEKVRITSGGLVGVGTITPSLSFSSGNGIHIAGGNAGLKLQNTNNGDWAFVEYADETNTTKYIQGYRDSSGVYAIRPGASLNATPGISLDSNGNIGINEISPNRRLYISGSESTAYSATSGSNNAYLRLHNKNGTDNTGVDNQAGIEFYVGDGATSVGMLTMERTGNNVGDFTYKTRTGASTYAEYFRVSSSGNIGLNETVPYYKLHMVFNNAATAFSGGNSGQWGGDGIRLENTNTTAGSMSLVHYRNYDADWHVGSKYVASNNSSFIFSCEGSTPLVQIDNEGRVKIGDIANPEASQTDCPVYIDMHTDITAFNTAEGAANSGFVRLEETGSNNGRYHGIELRNRNSGDIRIMNLDVSTNDRGDLVFAMPDAGASTGLHFKTRFNSLKGSLQIAGKNGATLANSATEHVDVYIATKTGVTAVDSGAGAEIAGLIRFEDKGDNNGRYHGLEIRNRNSGDVRILNLDEGTTNKSNMVLAVDDGSNIVEAMKLHSSGYVTTPLQPSFNAYKNGHFNFTSNSNTVIKPWTEHHDNHSDFDPTSGIFTAPVAGKYFFYVTVMQQRQGNGDFQLKIYKNGNLYLNSNDMNDPNTTTFQQTTINGIVDMSANDTVTFVTRNSTDTSSFLYNGHYTHCGGYLIG